MHEILKEFADLVGQELASRWLKNPKSQHIVRTSPKNVPRTDGKKDISDTKSESKE